MLLFWNGYEQIVALCIICFKTRGRTNRIHLGYESSLLFWLFSDPQNPQISDPADWSGLSPPVRPPSHSPPLRENFGGCTSMYCGGALRTGEVVKSQCPVDDNKRPINSNNYGIEKADILYTSHGYRLSRNCWFV